MPEISQSILVHIAACTLENAITEMEKRFGEALKNSLRGLKIVILMVAIDPSRALNPAVSNSFFHI